MQFAAQGFLLVVQRGNIQRAGGAFGSMIYYRFPQTFQETLCTFHTGFLPFQRHICWRRKHHEQTYGVGTVTFNHQLRVDTVVFRFRHFGHACVDHFTTVIIHCFGDAAFFVTFDFHVNRADPDAGAVFGVVEGICQHHALTQQAGERLITLHHAGVTQQFMEEPCVEQVHTGVFDPADVLIDRQPVVGFVGIQHALFIIRAAVTGEIPGRFHEGIEGIGFAQCRLAVISGFSPLRVGLDRTLYAVHHHIFRQNHRQLIRRRRHYCAVFQRQHRDWGTPVTLTGHTPVTQTIVHGALTQTFGFQFGTDGIKCLLEVQTVEFAGIKQCTFLGVGSFGYIRC